MKFAAGGLGLLLILMLVVASPAAPVREVAVGEAYPGTSFAAPQDTAHRKYLGLKPGQALNPARISARAVVIEIFNIY